MKFETAAPNLENALRNIKPYTSTDDATKVLHHIRIRFTETDVVVDATDRYAVAQYRIPRLDAGGNGSFLMHKSALDVLLPALKQQKFGVGVSVGDELTVAGVSVPLGDGDFPAVERLWPATLPEPSGPFALQPSALKRLGQYKPMGRGDNSPWQLFAGEARKPIVVLRGEFFRVLVMGVGEASSLLSRADGWYSEWANVSPI